MKPKQNISWKQTMGNKITPVGAYTIVVVTAFLAGALWIYITAQLSYNSSLAAIGRSGLPAMISGFKPANSTSQSEALQTSSSVTTPCSLYEEADSTDMNMILMSPATPAKTPATFRARTNISQNVPILGAGSLTVYVVDEACVNKAVTRNISMISPGVYDTNFDLPALGLSYGNYKLITIAQINDPNGFSRVLRSVPISINYSNDVISSDSPKVKIESPILQPLKRTYTKGETVNISYTVRGVLDESVAQYRGNPIVVFRLMRGNESIIVMGENKSYLGSKEENGEKVWTARVPITLSTGKSLNNDFSIRVELKGANATDQFRDTIYSTTQKFSIN